MRIAAIAELMKKIQQRKWYKEMHPAKYKIISGRTAYYEYKNAMVELPETRIDEETILHELAHHIEHEHAVGFIRYRGVMHGENFHTILARLWLDVPLADVIKHLSAYAPAPGWKWLPATRKWKKV